MNGRLMRSTAHELGCIMDGMTDLIFQEITEDDLLETTPRDFSMLQSLIQFKNCVKIYLEQEAEEIDRINESLKEANKKLDKLLQKD